MQTDLEATASTLMPNLLGGEYYCTFLAKHPSDTKFSNNCSRWWPDRYRYSKDSVTNDIKFGDRILFRPNVTPNPKKFIQWVDSIDLSLSSCCLIGPFNFEPVDKLNRTHNKVQFSLWHQLSEICHDENILPPTGGGQRRFNPGLDSIPKITKKRKRVSVKGETMRSRNTHLS